MKLNLFSFFIVYCNFLIAQSVPFGLPRLYDLKIITDKPSEIIADELNSTQTIVEISTQEIPETTTSIVNVTGKIIEENNTTEAIVENKNSTTVKNETNLFIANDSTVKRSKRSCDSPCGCGFYSGCGSTCLNIKLRQSCCSTGCKCGGLCCGAPSCCGSSRCCGSPSCCGGSCCRGSPCCSPVPSCGCSGCGCCRGCAPALPCCRGCGSNYGCCRGCRCGDCGRIVQPIHLHFHNQVNNFRRFDCCNGCCNSPCGAPPLARPIYEDYDYGAAVAGLPEYDYNGYRRRRSLLRLQGLLPFASKQ